MGFFTVIHNILDYLLSFVRLAQNKEVGWLSLDRKSGKLIREQQPILKKLKLLFLFNPVTNWIDTTHEMRLWTHKRTMRAGREEGLYGSKKQIKGFVETYHINMDDFEPSDINAYPTFEDFFVRRHAPGARPIHEKDDPRSAVVVADSRVVTYETVSKAKKLWIKGLDFSITNLVMDSQLGPKFDDGSVASFRLSPQDYHRYHSPVTGTIKQFRSMPGDYYQVDPVALDSHVDILTRNAREYVVIETEDFGLVLFVAIGATDVGSVRIHEQWQQPGSRISKGDELGVFQFGGSSIIVAFQTGRIEFDEDLLNCSSQRIQVSVEVGMSLGKATKSSS
ncbi:putative phosphatidylserine decarboxylase [Rhizodiscina lignyota]|uniref:phosphatidylserine decarboxylase n=1 Tax=Rhizodiscina lignyota TaxID=1504668 RepID=A0A9P4MBB3_9PEZI|nr:putative phosphatidylserine decarboxylase [Rhizodiscina lignyota]